MNDLVDHYWGAINNLNGLTRSSELKAGLILSFYGILLGIILDNVPKIASDMDGNTLFYVITCVWIVCVALSILFSFRCFMPRLATNYDKNAFFFKDAITKFGDVKEYSNALYNISTNEEMLFQQLGQQVYILSEITDKKFMNVNRSLKFLGASFVILFLGIVLYTYATNGA